MSCAGDLGFGRDLNMPGSAADAGFPLSVKGEWCILEVLDIVRVRGALLMGLLETFLFLFL
jgi:hypothetical protein